jgi:hypothetical protein
VLGLGERTCGPRTPMSESPVNDPTVEPSLAELIKRRGCHGGFGGGFERTEMFGALAKDGKRRRSSVLMELGKLFACRF